MTKGMMTATKMTMKTMMTIDKYFTYTKIIEVILSKKTVKNEVLITNPLWLKRMYTLEIIFLKHIWLFLKMSG